MPLSSIICQGNIDMGSTAFVNIQDLTSMYHEHGPNPLQMDSKTKHEIESHTIPLNLTTKTTDPSCNRRYSNHENKNNSEGPDPKTHYISQNLRVMATSHPSCVETYSTSHMKLSKQQFTDTDPCLLTPQNTSYRFPIKNKTKRPCQKNGINDSTDISSSWSKSETDNVVFLEENDFSKAPKFPLSPKFNYDRESVIYPPVCFTPPKDMECFFIDAFSSNRCERLQYDETRSMSNLINGVSTPEEHNLSNSSLSQFCFQHGGFEKVEERCFPPTLPLLYPVLSDEKQCESFDDSLAFTKVSLKNTCPPRLNLESSYGKSKLF